MMSAQTRTADYFKAGGTLHLSSPSYVKRPADDELFRKALAGQFCYVLTSRQRGKSSLMIRTAERLREAGVQTSIVDLSGLGTQVTQEQWYLGMIARIVNDLRLPTDAEQWWRKRRGVGPIQRFTDFLHDVVLERVAGRVVIFLDEIDSTLKLDFTDDFFAAIRVMYNARASNPEYDRLTFVLLGVATPTDLVKDRKRTPFNIGQRIELPELRRSDAAPLEAGLDQRFPRRGSAILDRIFHWTSGHPYLTQRICLEVTEAPQGAMSDAQIDAIVDRLFLSEDARKKENNLNYVDSAIRAIKDRRPLMKLYRRVFDGERVAEDKRDPVQERLRLVGLVRAEDGVLNVRNQIYRRVFDLPWIKQNTPRNTAKIVSIAAVLVTVVALAGGIYVVDTTRRNANAITIQTAIRDYEKNQSSAVKLADLRQLCETENGASAIDLFYTKQTTAQRLALFDGLDNSVHDDLGVVIRCLQPQSQSPAAEREQLLAAMGRAACRAGLSNDPQVAQDLGALRCSAYREAPQSANTTQSSDGPVL
jgi:hypothetical protein